MDIVFISRPENYKDLEFKKICMLKVYIILIICKF